MPHEHLAHTWNWTFVVLSYVIASVASYVSLEIASRSGGSAARRLRVLGVQGALLGFGIWSMHFIGMLAFRTDTPVSYDLPLTLVSGVAAVAFLALALFVLDRGRPTFGRLLTGGTIAGFGICVMHYLGMAAMRLNASSSYDAVPFALSVLIAVSAATVALFLFSQTRSDWAARLDAGRLFGLKVGAALVMGVAIVGMHYTGMAAVRFKAGTADAVVSNGGLDTGLLGSFVLLATGGVLLSALVGLVLDFDGGRRPSAGD